MASRQNLAAISASLKGTGGEVGSLDVVGHGEGAGGKQGKSLMVMKNCILGEWLFCVGDV